MGRRRGGGVATVQNMLDAIFGVQLSGHLRFSHEWRCAGCYSEDHYTQHTPPLHLLLWSFACSHSRVYRDHIWYCDDDVWLLVGRFLTKIESVACQIWPSLGQLTIFPCFTCWVDQEQAIRTFYGSDQPPAARPVNGTFPSFYGRSIPLILIKIIRSYLVLYIAQTVPTHPESFHIDRFEIEDQMKWISL